MDPELKAYFDERFRENAEQISALREENAQRFDQIDGRFERVERRFEGIDRRFEGVDRLFEGVDRRFERLEETGRQTLVLVESQSGDIRLIAEGHAALNARVDRLTSEVTQIFGQVKAWIEPFLRNLDRRIRILEGQAKRQEGEVL